MRKVLIIILGCVALAEGNGQSSIPSLPGSIVDLQYADPGMKLHLVFNQLKFCTGDTVWFRADLLMDDGRYPAGRQLVDVYLVNADCTPDLHITAEISNGSGHNQFVVPIRLTSGIYIVTAYARGVNSGKNTPDFTQQIVVAGDKKIVKDTTARIAVGVEGGHLVGSVFNRVVMKANLHGDYVEIVTEKGEPVGSARVDKAGHAAITFKPENGTSYFARVQDDTRGVALPETEIDGCSILLTPSHKRDVPVLVDVNIPPASRLHDEPLALLVFKDGHLSLRRNLLFHGINSVSVSVDQLGLSEGIAHVYIMNQSGGLLAGRDFYVQGENVVHAEIQVASRNFKTRDKVQLELSLSDMLGNPLEGTFSIGVTNAALFGEAERQAGVEDPYEDALQSGGQSEPDWRMNVDNSLILNWREQELHPKIDEHLRGFPVGTLQMEGSVRFSGTEELVPDRTAIMFYLQKSSWRYQTTTKGASVHLNLPDTYGADELLYVAINRKGNEIPDVDIDWDDKRPAAFPCAPPSVESGVQDPYASFEAKRRQITIAYHAGPQMKMQGGKTDSVNTSELERQLGKPDVTIRIADYILFPTMKELVREIIPSLYNGKRKGSNALYVKLGEPMRTGTYEPTFLVDGIATRNTPFFLSLDPADLLSVSIVKDPRKLLPLGFLGMGGVVIVHTKSGNVREPADMTHLVEGLNQPWDFAVRDYSSDPNRNVPDFRTTIYWNPEVVTGSKGKAIVEFYCSDDPGKMDIRVEGLTGEGQSFSAQDAITVH